MQHVTGPMIGNQLAWINTVFGLQRTLMAAQRTGVTLIGFGFTLAQLFENLKREMPAKLLALGPHVPRDVGLLMIATGIVSVGVFIWEYRKALTYLSQGPFAELAVGAHLRLHQLSCTTGYAIIAIGVLALGSIFVTF